MLETARVSGLLNPGSNGEANVEAGALSDSTNQICAAENVDISGLSNSLNSSTGSIKLEMLQDDGELLTEDNAPKTPVADGSQVWEEILEKSLSTLSHLEAPQNPISKSGGNIGEILGLEMPIDAETSNVKAMSNHKRKKNGEGQAKPEPNAALVDNLPFDWKKWRRESVGKSKKRKGGDAVNLIGAGKLISRLEKTTSRRFKLDKEPSFSWKKYAKSQRNLLVED